MGLLERVDFIDIDAPSFRDVQIPPQVRIKDPTAPRARGQRRGEKGVRVEVGEDLGGDLRGELEDGIHV